jgi:leucyl aminopeptidase
MFMEALVKVASLEKLKTPCLIVAAFEGGELSASAAAIDKAAGGLLRKLARRGDLSGRSGQPLVLHAVEGILAERVVVVGCGRAGEFSERGYRRAVQEGVQRAELLGAREAVCTLHELTVKERPLYWKLRQAVEVAGDVAYRFDGMKSKKEGARAPLERLHLLLEAKSAEADRACLHGNALVRAMNRMRDLGNMPPNICNPVWLAGQAREIARGKAALKVTVMGPERLRTLGMNTLMAVAQGSDQPPAFIVMEYKGSTARGAQPVVLVGKGVTFDTGGISIKPAASMDEMKYDMCGAASVLSTMQAVAELKLPINVIGVVPSVENMPSGKASRPGDVVTSLSGQTVEILNTDAEGRLILCDALTWAERYKPAVVIDIATLTGACVIALGAHAHGLFSNDDALASELLSAGNDSHDRGWHMPVWEDYQSQLDSNFADMANIGGREAGAITAACFLARFMRKQRWAHLDIAGTAWRGGKDKGATGRPVPMLLQFLLARAGLIP